MLLWSHPARGSSPPSASCDMCGRADHSSVANLRVASLLLYLYDLMPLQTPPTGPDSTCTPPQSPRSHSQGTTAHLKFINFSCDVILSNFSVQDFTWKPCRWSASLLSMGRDKRQPNLQRASFVIQKLAEAQDASRASEDDDTARYERIGSLFPCIMKISWQFCPLGIQLSLPGLQRWIVPQGKAKARETREEAWEEKESFSGSGSDLDIVIDLELWEGPCDPPYIRRLLILLGGALLPQGGGGRKAQSCSENKRTRLKLFWGACDRGKEAQEQT